MDQEEIIDRRVSFNAGVVSEFLDPRIDLDKYRSACSQLRNMLPSPYGGAFRRMGTVYLGSAMSDNRAFLYTYTAGNGTSWVLEFTDSVLRIWTTGTTPALVQSGGSDLEIATPYATADLRSLQFAQLNDLLFIAHPSHAPRVLVRESATSWDLRPFVADYPATLPKNGTDITLSPGASAPSSAAWDSATTYAAGDRVTHDFGGVNHTFSSRENGNLGKDPALTSKYANGYKGWWTDLGPTASIGSTPVFSIGKRITLTASEAIFNSSMEGQRWILEYDQATMSKTMDLTAASANDLTGELYALGTWSAQLTATTTGAAGFTVQAIVQRSFDGDDWEQIAELAGNFSDVQQLITGSEDIPCFIRIKLLAKSGTLPTDYTARIDTTAAKQRGVVRLISYLTTTTFRARVEFPVPSSAGATLDWYEDAWGGNSGWPGAIAIHEGRMFLGGTQFQPGTIWGSRVDDFGDFRLAAEDDAAVSYQLASENSSRIRWMTSADDLLVGTLRDEWTIARRNATETPRARRQSTIGSARRQGLLIDDSVLYIQTSERKLREFAWNPDRSRYSSNDLTLLAEHLGDSEFKEFAAQTNIHTVVWVISNNGNLNSCLYDRSQNITGWANHDTASGAFASVTTVPSDDGTEDQVWFCVTRTIDGSTVNYIERLNPASLTALKGTSTITANLVYVDCMIPSTAGSGTIAGLSALEGETVQVITTADGLYRGDFVVASGAIDISADPFTGNVLVGLAYDSIIAPTFLEFDDPKFSSKAGKKRLTRAVLELYKSRGGKITGNEYRNYVDINDGLATDDSLFTGLIETYIQADSERQTTPRIKTNKPFPLNVMAIASRYLFGPA